MNQTKEKTMGIVLAIVLTGTVLGVILRLALMLNFFDYPTGFYTDGGVVAWLSLGAPLAAAVLAGIVCYRGRSGFGTYRHGKRLVLAALACVSGLFLLRLGAVMAADYQEFLRTGLSQYDSVQQGFLHVLFIAASLVFGLIQTGMFVGFGMEKNIFAKLPLLYLAAPLWGITYLIQVYLFYAKSSSVVENFFSVVGAAALLMALFYICKICAGVDVPGAAKRLFVTGGLAVALGGSYILGNVALYFGNRTYTGEMPIDCQMCALWTLAFVAAFMVDYRLHSGPDPREEAGSATEAIAEEAAPQEAGE